MLILISFNKPCFRRRLLFTFATLFAQTLQMYPFYLLLYLLQINLWTLKITMMCNITIFCMIFLPIHILFRGVSGIRICYVYIKSFLIGIYVGGHWVLVLVLVWGLVSGCLLEINWFVVDFVYEGYYFLYLGVEAVAWLVYEVERT